MSLSTSVHELRMLIDSFHPVVVIETAEEARVDALLAAVAQKGRLAHFEWTVTRGLVRAGEAQPVGGTQDPLQFLRHVEGLSFDAIFHLKDFGAFASQAPVARKLREVAQRFSHTRSALVLSGVRVELPGDVEVLAVRYPLALPGREELREVLRTVIESLRARARVAVELEPGDLDALLGALSGLTQNQARQALAWAVLQSNRLGRAEIELILSRKRERLRDSGPLEYFPFEDNRYELAGFAGLKRWLERARTGFSPEAKALGLQPPRGILLVGVQGCGKSLAARSIARLWRLPLLRLDTGSLYAKWVGETEKNLRDAFRQAEAMAPVVLWLDEIEKGLATAASSEGDGGVSRRLLGAFLTWLSEKPPGVFVVATANDVFALPPELVRKGRFDEIFFVDLPSRDERRAIFEVHLSLRKQEPKEFDLDELVGESDGMSGAEIEQAVIAGLYRALHEKRGLETQILLEELRATVPLSVSRREDVQRLRALARERFVPVA
jgi:hypothetical protein